MPARFRRALPLAAMVVALLGAAAIFISPITSWTMLLAVVGIVLLLPSVAVLVGVATPELVTAQPGRDAVTPSRRCTSVTASPWPGGGTTRRAPKTWRPDRTGKRPPDVTRYPQPDRTGS